jgi:AP-1 complex subunit beta-1
VKDFDVMFNKNPFGIAIYNAANAIEIPDASKVEKALACTIDKKNLDAKNPPKHPFNAQVALKCTLDVFYFEVPCLLYCLIDSKNPMIPEEFKKFWEMIPKANEFTLTVNSIYPGYTLLGEKDLAKNIA